MLEILKSTDVPYNSLEDFGWGEGGTVWLYRAETHDAAEDWRKAGHIMNQMNGGTVIGAKSERSAVIFKKCSALVTNEKRRDTRFKRYHWTHDGRPLHVLIQFIGDHTLSTPVYHRNSKSADARPRNPLINSLARQLATSKEKPAPLYERYKMRAGFDSEAQRLYVPSNRSQPGVYNLNRFCVPCVKDKG